MSCDACNNPTTPAIAAESRAFLTDPVTAPAQSCYTPPENPCSPPVSRLRNLGKFIPGWTQKLTPAAMGRLVIAVGDALHWFRPNNPGPLYFDGENVTVGGQPTLTAKATDASLVEYGHLTLAKKVSKAEILPNGTAANLEYFEHGVQAVREIGFGEMLGLSADPASGAVRVDVIQPEYRNLIKKGLPAGFRRLGYAQVQVEGSCGLQSVKKFFEYTGAVFGAEDLSLEKAGGGPAILYPVTVGGVTYYVLGTPKDGVLSGGFSASDLTDEAAIEDYFKVYSQISVLWTDEDGDKRVSYKEKGADGEWYHPVTKEIDAIEVFSASNETVTDETVDVAAAASIPADAKFVLLMIRLNSGEAAASQLIIENDINQVVGGENYALLFEAAAGTGVKQQQVRVQLKEGGNLLFSATASGGLNVSAKVIGYER